MRRLIGMVGILAATAACDRVEHKQARPDTAPMTAATPGMGESGASLIDPLLHDEPLDVEAHKWWMEKATRTLTGHELGDAVEDPALGQLSKAEFVEQLMKDPGFEDTVLGFNLYFLGFKDGSVRESEGSLRNELLRFPNAIAAARAVTSGGDYLQLLQYQQPMLAPPLQAMQGTDTRPELEAKIVAKIDQINTYVSGASVDKTTLCSMVFSQDGLSLDNLLMQYGAPEVLTNSVSTSPQWLGGLDLYCFFADIPVGDLAARFAQITTRLPILFNALHSLEAANNHIMVLADLKTVDAAAIGFELPSSLTTDGFYSSLPNSSTSYDRKRGAYMLKRYFCDDLTPIALATPEQHASDRHASDPACQSCHYKLDPMSGFFKDRGAIGFDFTGAPKIIFDDQATADLATYETAWRAPANAGRSWDIGYVRSVDHPDMNSYGETLPDLFHIIQTSREVKQCLVRRIFEHFVGEEQVIDPEYLDYMTTKFEDTARDNSVTAFKEAVARMVLGKTFSEPDLVSSECYDRVPGHEDGVAPPCAVSFLLQKECAACHSAQGAAGGLNLTGWIKTADGTYDFPHLKNGQQVATKETFQGLYDRLTSSDRDRRMPLGMFMPSADREQMFLWVDGVLNGQGGH